MVAATPRPHVSFSVEVTYPCSGSCLLAYSHILSVEIGMFGFSIRCERFFYT